jgi:glycerol-3-phosphate dehydrogenase subunit B
MATADVVVVGAGLAGLTAAIALADAGARVEVVATGHAATHWTAGGFDLGGLAGSRTSAEGIATLSRRSGHPYAVLGGGVEGALAWLRAVLATEGLRYVGELGDPLRAVPTAIGGTRRAAVLPSAQARALGTWGTDERLVIVGPVRFKDTWPAAIAASLSRASVWGSLPEPGNRPGRVEALVVELPGLADRHNLSALDLARAFDDPTWRGQALAAIARAIDRARRRGPGRVALPAALGLDDHGAAFEDASRILPLLPFEMPLVPPSIPGLRLYRALRAAVRRRGGRVSIGEPVSRIVVERGWVQAVAVSAAARERVVRTGGLVLATGGIAGGGLIGRSDGTLVEPLLGLPVEGPPPDDWLAADPFDRRGHPLEAAGIRTDDELRPVDGSGRVLLDNVVVAGSLLAGQRYLSERSGDGVAIASGHRAAAVLLGNGAAPQRAPRRIAARARS